jgi:4-phosphopantoate--beta-alanine ligase
MSDIPETHPRRASLLSRQKLVDAQAKGMLANSALIAHGRGEAFDYLLGEKTATGARVAAQEVLARMRKAQNPVISVNGNTVALAIEKLLLLADKIGCPIEVNIYYRTPERMTALLDHIEEVRSNLGVDVPILGSNPDGKIPNLDGPRAKCCSNGILNADTILVPLEDGDRCEALINMGKEVFVIDLNPLSRTARMATICIVDEISRAIGVMLEIDYNAVITNPDFDSISSRESVLDEMLEALKRSQTEA